MPWSQAKNADTNQRRAQLIQMRIKGVSYDRIAEQLGYSTPNVARKEFTRAKRDARELAADEADIWRELQSDRYDELIAAHWDAATSGEDLKAAELVRKTIGDQADLWGVKRLQIDATVTEVTQEDIELQQLINEARAKNALKEAELRGEQPA